MLQSEHIPVIETARLRLRGWRERDIAALAEIRADPEVGQWVGFPDPARTAEAIAAWLELWLTRGFGMWAVEVKEGGAFIGRVGLVHHADWIASEHDAEIGWTLARSEWGKGYATEAARAVVGWAQDRGAPRRIISITRPDNVRSRRVMEKIGLELAGETHWRGYDQVWYTLDRARAMKVNGSRVTRTL